MKKQAWTHLGWAVAAAVAFYVGSKTAAPVADDRLDSERALQAERARGAAGSLLRGEGQRGGRSRRSDADALGPLEKLFGSYSLDRVGIKALTEQALKAPSPVTRRIAFARVLENMTTENAMEIREVLVALDPDNSTWTEFNYSWGALAGREAFEFALKSDEPDLNATMMGWAAVDPAGAIAMMDQLPPELERQRSSLEYNLIAGIADNDIGLATQLALSRSAADPRLARRLVNPLVDETLRSGGIVTATQWAEALPEGEAKGAALRRVSDAYVRKDPVAALGWLSTLPPSGAQNEGYGYALSEWSRRDPQAAGEYLMAMERTPQRDAAIAGFARSYVWQDPETAIAWVEDIADPKVRQESLIRAGQAYHRRAPEKAKIWLQNSGLSEDEQREAMTGRR